MSLLNAMEKHILRFTEGSSGATMIEYALIFSLISIAIGFVLPEIKATLGELYLYTASGLENAAAVAP